MEEEQENRINRRRVLGALGATAGAAVNSGLVQRVSASPEQSRGIRNSESVQQILDAVGSPKITGQTVKVLHGDEYKTRIAELETKYGVVTHYEVLRSTTELIDKGDSSADLKISLADADTRASLPDKFQHIPTGVTVSLRYKNQALSVSTSVTASERDRLVRLVGSEQIEPLYIDDPGYYYVMIPGEQDYRIETDAQRPAIQEPDVTQIAETQLDEAACFDCGKNATGCAVFCSFDCNPISGGALSCAACISQECRDVDVKSCARCIASFTDDAPLV